MSDQDQLLKQNQMEQQQKQIYISPQEKRYIYQYQMKERSCFDDVSQNWRIFLFEMIGTAIFAHGILSSGHTTYGDAVVALSLYTGILFAAPFSGGHLNPAVTTAFLTIGGITGSQWFPYVIGQIFGAFIGGCTAKIIYDISGAPYIKDESGGWVLADLFGEILATFTFLMVILIMAHDETRYYTGKNHKVYVFATIAAGLYFSRQLTNHSGGCLNPGIALGLELYMSMSTHDWKYFRRGYVYIVGPILGAVFAALFYDKYWRRSYVEKEQDKQKKETKVEEFELKE